MKVFVDNDVILDVLLERVSFRYSQKVLELVEAKRVVAFTSPIIFTNSFYIITRARSKKKAWEALKKMRLLFRVAKIDESMVDRALSSEIIDFEDAVQYYSALAAKVDYLVTRNRKDYVEKGLVVVTPKELLAVLLEQASAITSN